MRIFTHNGYAHMDDFLAVGLLLNLYPDSVVIRTNKLPDLEDNDIVVDTGMKSDGVRFFDHHQDLNCPASFVQVLKAEYGIDVYELKDLMPELVYLDLADRFGPQRANREMGVQIPWQDLMAQLVVGMVSFKEKIAPGDFEHTLLREIGASLLRRIKNVQKAKDIILSSPLVSVPSGVVLYNLDECININVAHKLISNLVGVICKNQMNENDLSIISINNNPSFNPPKIKEIVPTVFIHATGFLAVVKREDFLKHRIEDVVLYLCAS